ncbi:RNA methyltransferase [Desulfocurvibacter africanus]|uniref:RNA methyltransferase n=1 Tax=Desulfocurvibacter africanus TaxID=873 RepID=UPI002FDACBD1
MDICVLLDSLTSAHNVGAIFRLCDAALVSRLYLCGGTPAPPSLKINRGSRRCWKWVPWEHCEDAALVVQELKSQGIKIVSVELADTSRLYHEADLSGPACLILGNETSGVSPRLLELSDLIVRLPMLGMGNSINVSTAASVVLYESLRQSLQGTCVSTAQEV